MSWVEGVNAWCHRRDDGAAYWVTWDATPGTGRRRFRALSQRGRGAPMCVIPGHPDAYARRATAMNAVARHLGLRGRVEHSIFRGCF